MKLRAKQGRWEIMNAPPGTKLTRVTVDHEVIEDHAGGQTHYFAGKQNTSITVRHADGRSERLENVEVVWDNFQTEVK
jgi:hypothetical protein